MKFESELEIARPIDQVWDAFVDPENLQHWQRNLLSYELLEGEAGHPGAVTEFVFDETGHELILTETVIERVEHEYFHSDFDSAHARFSMKSWFEDTGDGSTIHRMVQDVSLKGAAKFAGPMIKGRISDRAERLAADFKSFVESR